MSDAPSPAPDATASIRRWIYLVLITVTAGLTAGRLLSIQLVYEPSLHRPADDPKDPRRVWPVKPPKAMPTFSSNDRARWATIRALVDEGAYAVGRRVTNEDGTYKDEGIIFEDGWGSVDKVLHPERQEFYSSKPPLLPTLLAGEYWLLQQGFGWTLKDQPWEVVRVTLFTVNWLPLLIYLWLLSRLVDRLGTSDFGRVFTMATACFGTYLTTFIITLNNHTLAAFCVLYALYPCIAIWMEERQEAWRYALAGFFAAFTACNELPAASFGVMLFALLLLQSVRNTLLFFVPAALIPIAGFFATNYLSLGEILPAYEKFGTVWYEYPGSYWLNKKGIDKGDVTTGVYAFHLLIGHHGIFSLTPAFLLSLAGMVLPVVPAFRRQLRSPQSLLAVLTLVLTAILVGFYLMQTKSYNYGGWTSGPRWFFWLIPLWLLVLLPVADRLGQSRLGRLICCVLLAFSCLSAAYPAWNPWRMPWIYNLLEYVDAIRY